MAVVKAAIILLLLLFALPYGASALTREVGSGQTHATIQACLNVAVAGDICNVHAGTYTEQLALVRNGTAVSRITIQRNGSDVVLVTNTSSPVVNLNGMDYHTIDGIRMRYTGTAPQARTLVNNNGANIDGLIIRNCYLSLINGGADSIVALIYSADNMLIEDNTVEIEPYAQAVANHGVNGLTIDYSQNYIVRRNNIFGAASETLGRGMDLLLIDGSNILIEENLIHDGWALDTHPDCIPVQADHDRDGNAPRDITIVRNTIYNCTSGVYVYTLGTNGFNLIGTNIVANNVIYETTNYRYGGERKMNCLVSDADHASSATDMTIQVQFYNNTLDCRQLQLHVLRQSTPGGNTTFRNNIIRRCEGTAGASVVIDSVPTTLVMNNNYYDNPASDCFAYLGVRYSLANFKTTTGQEANAVSGTVNLNADYTENASSDSINRGVDLSAFFTTDRAGVTRTIPWDMGAYEFGSGADVTPPAAPTGLTIQ